MIQKEKYYIADYIREFSGRTIRKSKKEVWEMLVEKLSKCVLCINSSKLSYVIKESSVTPFRMLEDLKYDNRFVYFEHTNEEGNKKKGKLKIFEPLEHDRRFWFDLITSIPYVPNIDPPIDDSTNYPLNIFPGFKAQFVADVDMKIINPILNHIKEVIANNNW
jgi:hypothetical protein